MLSEMKQIYSDQANFIPNWKQLSKTELCNLYIQNEEDEMRRNAYFSALILNYWNKIYSLQANTYLTATLEDTYQWVVDGILYALKHRKWLDPNNKLFTDPDGPDKVINRKIKCIRINHLISENRYKRKIHVNLLSIDSFEDSENLIVDSCSSDDTISSSIRNSCSSGDVFKAILIEFISDGSCFVADEDGIQEFDFDKLVSQVEQIDDGFIDQFVKKYGLTYESVYDSVYKTLFMYTITDLWGFGVVSIKKPHFDVYKLVEKEFKKLQQDQELKSLLC